MTANFNGKVAFVSGAGSGIGRATAFRFAELGATVVAADVSEHGAQTVDEIKDNGGDAGFLRLDVSDAEQFAECTNAIVQRYGRLDFAYNNAGTSHPAGNLVDVDLDTYERVIAVNLRGVFLGLKTQIPVMVSQGFGSIVNTTSMWGLTGAPGKSVYSASKHGVIGLTKSAASEYGSTGIRINAVAPGPIETAMTARVNPGAMKKTVERTASKRMGEAEELAAAVTWLCSDEASFVNGAVIPVDGGWGAA